MRLGEDALAERHLEALRDLPISPSLRGQVGRVLEGMRAGPVSPALRQFIVAALDETMSADRLARQRALAERIRSRNFPYFP